jgi:group I intron endonuclease
MGIIYKAENLVNGKCYVGQTTLGLKKRIQGHQNDKKYNSYPFLNALNKYDKEDFEWTILENNIKKQSHLNILEKFWILYLNSRSPNGYNLQEGGARGKQHESTKIKMSKIKMGKNNEMYGKRGKDCPNYGKHHSEKTKNKIRKAHQGKYPGAYYNKHRNPEYRCWLSRVRYNGGRISLGVFEDPFSASLVYKIVLREIGGI